MDKKDWLEKASDPYSGSYSHGIGAVGVVLLLLACAAVFFGSILFF